MSSAFLAAIRERGFEINIQDLNHDGRLFERRAQFVRRAQAINRYGREYGARGFRAGALYRNTRWFNELDFSYEMSIPNVAHLDPQRGGCCTVMPYFIGNILELPVTTTQDYSLFHILGDYSIDLWKTQTAAIMQHYGLASFITHPDYLTSTRAQRTYIKLLEFLSGLRSERKLWLALPGDVNDWWRQRSQMQLVQGRSGWRIEGPGKERARIAYATVSADGVRSCAICASRPQRVRVLAYPLRVLLLGAVPPPQGGVQVNLMAIRAFLLRRGDTCYAINLTRHRRRDHDGLFFPHSAGAVAALIVKLRADIIHLHIGGDLTMRLLLLGAMCSMMPRAKTVLTFHSGGYPSSEQGRRLTRESRKARLLRRFDRLIAVNDEIAEFFVRCGIDRKRVAVISPHASVQPHQGRLPQRLEQFIREHNPFLITIGLLEPEYDLGLQIDLVGDMLATHPRTGLLIVGSGSLEGSLRERIAGLAWRDHILLYGDLEHAVTLAALERADVFLRTTIYDGDALSVREALEFGVPVVATRTALRPAGARLVDIGNRADVQRAVLESLHEKRDRPMRSQSAGDENIAAVVRLYEQALA